MMEELKKEVYEANKQLFQSGLVVLTWGNVSGIDREKGLVVIKPSGVEYDTLTPEDMVVVDMKGNIVEGKWRPSVDLPTHLELYQAFLDIKGIVHNHSTFATSFAQAECEIPCYGTTQADTFNGSIPLVRLLKKEELTEYTKNTGKAIVERFHSLDYHTFPGALLSKHGVFSWGNSPKEAVHHAVIMEECAKMAYLSQAIRGDITPLPNEILKLHYERKHGKNKTYGQEK